MKTVDKKKNGFTLIELSIVLVIIGLLVGGILVGQELIKAAELRQIANKYQEFNTAINTFKLKYNCLPGDCTDTYDFFGADLACEDDFVGTGMGGSFLNNHCNGDGDKRISHSREQWRAWQSLELSGLISEGILPLTDLADALDLVQPDVSGDGAVPTGPRKIVWFLYHDNDGGYSSGTYYTHLFKLVLPNAGQSSCCNFVQATQFAYREGALNEMDASNLDSKLDDGVYNSGKIRGDRAVKAAGGWDTCNYNNGANISEDNRCEMHLFTDIK